MPKLRVTRIDTITPRIRRVELQNAEGGELPAFTAGAHIDVELSNGEARSYSLLNDASERNRYVLGVLREQDGTGGSAWIHDHLKVGDVLTAQPPSNDFPRDEEGGHHILMLPRLHLAMNCPPATTRNLSFILTAEIPLTGLISDPCWRFARPLLTSMSVDLRD